MRARVYRLREITIGKWPPLPPRTPHILSYNRGNLPRGQLSCTHDSCGYLCVICLIGLCIGRFVCKTSHHYNHSPFHTPLSSILYSALGVLHKRPKRAGQSRGVCHSFVKNHRQPPYPCSCLISLASTTDKLIFESYVIVTYLT